MVVLNFLCNILEQARLCQILLLFVCEGFNNVKPKVFAIHKDFIKHLKNLTIRGRETF